MPWPSSARSTAIADGKSAMLVCSGLCKIGVDCPSGTAYSVAAPADPTNPTYKPSYNPIANGTGW